MSFVMVLFVGNDVQVRNPPKDLLGFLNSSSRIREDVDTFQAKIPKRIGEEDGKFDTLLGPQLVISSVIFL